MSLINQMLKDLERREKSPLEKAVALSGLTTTGSRQFLRLKKRHLLIVLMIFFAALLLLLLPLVHKKSVSPTLASITATSAATKNNAIDFMLPAKVTPATLTGI